MTEKQYKKMTDKIRCNKSIEKLLIVMCEYIPKIIVLIYAITSFYLALNKSSKLYLYIIVPAADLICVSLFRKAVNSKRPYENYNYEPIGKYKKDKGESFPSRHTSSAVIIAMACYYVNPVSGIFMWGLAVMVGGTRILCGVHYPKDVLGGTIISIIFGMIGFL